MIQLFYCHLSGFERVTKVGNKLKATEFFETSFYFLLLKLRNDSIIVLLSSFWFRKSYQSRQKASEFFETSF
jgi:hypothetical protein